MNMTNVFYELNQSQHFTDDCILTDHNMSLQQINKIIDLNIFLIHVNFISFP